MVYDDARVYGNAWVYGDARVYGDAWVYGDARVYGDALVYDDARVYGDALVYGNALVSGKIKLELWQCFARKEKDRDVSEVENAWIILLIKDYKPAEEEVMEMTVADVEKLTGRKVKIIK